MKARLNLKLSERNNEKLQRLAKEHGVSKTAAINLIIKNHSKKKNL